MNRKGMDVDFLLKFVLSLVGLAIVIGVVGTVLSRITYDGDVDAAKQMLSSLTSKAAVLNDGESNTFIVRGVEGWYLVGWNLNDGDSRPGKCYLNNCICVCRSPTRESCDKDNGICSSIKGREVRVITEPFTLTQDFSFSEDQVRDVKVVDFAPKCIPLSPNFFEVSVTKSKSEIVFSYKDRTVKSDDASSNKYLSGECNVRTIRN